MNWALELNKNWVAITATPTFRAIVLMFRGSAVAVCTDTYETFDIDQWIDRSCTRELPNSEVIRTVNLRIEKPEIILLRTYGGIPCGEINFNRNNLFARDKNKCQYCDKKFLSSKLTVDHVYPRSKGGITSFENCVASCHTCNNRKAGRTLRESGMKLIKRPTKPRWNPIMGFLPREYPDSWNTFLKK